MTEEIIFFILLWISSIIILAVLDIFCSQTCDMSNFTTHIKNGLDTAFFIWLITIAISLVFFGITQDGIETVENIPIYNIMENGEMTEYYTKITANTELIVNYGNEQTVDDFDSVISGYDGKPHVEKRTIIPDESKFLYSITPTFDKIEYKTLYVDKIK